MSIAYGSNSITYEVPPGQVLQFLAANMELATSLAGDRIPSIEIEDIGGERLCWAVASSAFAGGGNANVTFADGIADGVQSSAELGFPSNAVQVPVPALWLKSGATITLRWQGKAGDYASAMFTLMPLLGDPITAKAPQFMVDF